MLLLASFGEFAPARLAVVDAEGTVRTRTLDRVIEGTVVDEGSNSHSSRTISPGLAVDPEGRRAFVVPHAGTVAEIDLRTLVVSYHELDRPSLLGRLLRWLTPVAQAKLMEGSVRQAHWLGNGMIAVAGADYSVTSNARGEERVITSPAGVSLVDTRSWTSHTLDDGATGVAVAPGLVIAQGGGSESVQGRGSRPGLRAFDVDGRERWQLYAGKQRWIDPKGPVAYAYVGNSTADVVELETGAVLGRVRWDNRKPLPQLLAAQVSDW